MSGRGAAEDVAMNEPKSVKTYSSALGDADCVAGTFRYDAESLELHWSDEIYALHGYCRGEIVPTIELLYSHKHPEDRDRCRDVFAAACVSGGFFCSYHRLIDSRLREHRVLTAGEAVVEAGVLRRWTGSLSTSPARFAGRPNGRPARRSKGPSGHEAPLNRPRGILMGILRIGSDAAFDLLSTHSQHTNIKLSSTAADLVQLANSPHQAALLDTFVQELLLPSARAAGEDAVPGPLS